jgi:hypothetical protein
MRDFGHSKKHLGADTGMISILHTWGQNLSLHPHIHCIVPGGGLTPSGKWKQARSNGKFLFPVKAMSTVFRARFIAALRSEVKGLVPADLTSNLSSISYILWAVALLILFTVQTKSIFILLFSIYQGGNILLVIRSRKTPFYNLVRVSAVKISMPAMAAIVNESLS